MERFGWLTVYVFASFRYPYVIDSICANRPAALAGLQAGDSIMQLDGKNIAYFDFKEEMLRRQKADSASHDITLTYARAGVIDTITFATDSIYEIGVVARTATNQLLPVVKKEYSFLASFPAGAALGVQTLKGYVGQMKYLFSKEGAKQLGGFGTIGSIFPATWDWHQFLVYDGIPFYYPRLHEYPAYSGTGWRTCAIPYL